MEAVVEKVAKEHGKLSSTPIVNYCNTCPTTIRGLCCYFSYYDGVDNFVVSPCKYLNKKTRRCTIYKKRFEINKRCLPLNKALEQGALPKECRYVQEWDGTPIRPNKTINNEKLKELINRWKLEKKILLGSG